MKRLTWETSSAETKGAIITLQWFVAIGTSYLTLGANTQAGEHAPTLALIALLLGSVLVLRRLSDAVFESRRFTLGLAVFDTAVILCGIGLNRSSPWDLFLLFFICVFISAIGENITKTVFACFVMSIVFVAQLFSKDSDFTNLNSDVLMRIPFMFGVSVLYGYLTEQVNDERKRAEKIQETDRLKRQVVSTLANDIKSPLSVIVGYAEMLTWPATDESSSTNKLHCLKRIRQNIDCIVKLVTGLLDVSKLEIAKVQSAADIVQLNNIARAVVQQQTVASSIKNLRFVLELDENLTETWGDVTQLENVVRNLIDNAIKYTPAGGTIRVTSQMESKHVCLSVEDTGIGISAEDLPSLFSEFRRLENTADVEGTGLGLFIVKTVVEAHGGTVAVKSQQGVGTTFTIRLPVRK
jgi:signal transduction histidine kinase